MILALESSCDETAVAVFDPRVGIVGEWTHTQVALHGAHGGVVPDLATREHLRHFGPLLERAQAAIDFGRVETVAVTHGPGLAACLAIGVASAKALALALRRPLVGVNHLRAHAWSPFLPLHAANPGGFATEMAGHLPHLGLIVSGGNTLLFVLGADRSIRVLASTRDDAAGEALDKGAKLLGLGYPGGPLVERVALAGRPDAYDFPRGLNPRAELDFSFSGVKTSLRYLVEKMPVDEVVARRADLCASYQQAVLDALVRKAGAALDRGEGGIRSLGVSGGVANNLVLRRALEGLARRNRIPFLPALPRHTGDNAAMIAFAAWADQAGCDGAGSVELKINPSLELT